MYSLIEMLVGLMVMESQIWLLLLSRIVCNSPRWNQAGIYSSCWRFYVRARLLFTHSGNHHSDPIDLVAQCHSGFISWHENTLKSCFRGETQHSLKKIFESSANIECGLSKFIACSILSEVRESGVLS